MAGKNVQILIYQLRKHKLKYYLFIILKLTTNIVTVTHSTNKNK